LTVAAAGAWAALLWHSSGERSEIPARRGLAEQPAIERHFVTPNQLLECGAFADRGVEPFSAAAHDGVRFVWPGDGRPRPLVIVFIKRDCPCSVELEPFFHRLAERYRDAADFVGVIDADLDAARAYAAANKVPYHVLADPDRTIITQFEAKHGGYVALLNCSGRVDAFWPGCSDEMMRGLGRRIAVLGARAERPIDVSGMPKVLTTGCPYTL
jgi:peroxiredoxin